MNHRHDKHVTLASSQVQHGIYIHKSAQTKGQEVGHAWRKNVTAIPLLLPSMVARLAIPKPPAAGSVWPMRDFTALNCKGLMLP